MYVPVVHKVHRGNKNAFSPGHKHHEKLSPRPSGSSASLGPTLAPHLGSATPSPGQLRQDVHNQSSPVRRNIGKSGNYVCAHKYELCLLDGGHSDLDREAEALAALTSGLQQQTPGLLSVGLVQNGSRRKTPLIQHKAVPNSWEEVT